MENDRKRHITPSQETHFSISPFFQTSNFLSILIIPQQAFCQGLHNLIRWPSPETKTTGYSLEIQNHVSEHSPIVFKPGHGITIYQAVNQRWRLLFFYWPSSHRLHHRQSLKESNRFLSSRTNTSSIRPRSRPYPKTRHHMEPWISSIQSQPSDWCLWRRF